MGELRAGRRLRRLLCFGLNAISSLMFNLRTILRPRSRSRNRGFTLIEAALTTVIIGVGVMAMLELLAAGTSSNVDSSQLTTAMNLAKQVREVTIQKTFAEVLAMDGDAYDPPQDGSGLPMNTLGGWQQVIRVQPVDPTRLTLTQIDDDPSAVLVTVVVRHDGT